MVRTLISLRPVSEGYVLIHPGQPVTPEDAASEKRMLESGRYKVAEKKDIDDWNNRLSQDPALNAQLEAEASFKAKAEAAAKLGKKPDEKAKAKAEAEEKAKAEADEKARLEAEEKAKAGDAAAGGANPVRSEGEGAGPEGGAAAPVTGPGGIG